MIFVHTAIYWYTVSITEYTSRIDAAILSNYRIYVFPWENKWSPWAHGELTVTTVVTAPGPNDHGSVTDGLGRSSVTARSQLNHGDHGSVTPRSQLNHRPGHGSVTAQSRLAVTILVTVSSPWTHRELTMSSRWAVTEANFFPWIKNGPICVQHLKQFRGLQETLCPT